MLRLSAESLHLLVIYKRMSEKLLDNYKIMKIKFVVDERYSGTISKWHKERHSTFQLGHNLHMLNI